MYIRVEENTLLTKRAYAALRVTETGAPQIANPSYLCYRSSGFGATK